MEDEKCHNLMRWHFNGYSGSCPELHQPRGALDQGVQSPKFFVNFSPFHLIKLLSLFVVINQSKTLQFFRCGISCMMKIVTEIVTEWKGITIFLQWFPSIKKNVLSQEWTFQHDCIFPVFWNKTQCLSRYKIFCSSVFLSFKSEMGPSLRSHFIT